jgi:hypothetical protein
MKVTTERVNEKKFEPITVTITLETKDEFDDFHFLFNYVPLCSTLVHLDDDCIRQQLHEFEQYDGHRERELKLTKIIQ